MSQRVLVGGISSGVSSIGVSSVGMSIGMMSIMSILELAMLVVIISLMVSVVISNFVECGGDSMKNCADNCKNESSPREVARLILSIRILSRNIRLRVTTLITMSLSSRSAIGSCKNRNSDKCADKYKIEQNP